jgi:gamma-glutamyltranspeptidase/glutathione hydrolase
MTRRTCAALFALAALAVPLAHADPPTMFPPVRGTRHVVAAANNQEVAAGFRILEQGGNAVDAGVAAVLAAAVTEQSRFGLGGEMPLLVKMHGKPVVAISGVGVAPRRATVEYFRTRAPEVFEDPSKMPPIPAEGIKAAITPGVFDGLMVALQRYGTMSFAQVAAPAIDYADNGFPIAEEFAAFLHNYRRIMENWPASRDFFYPSGEAPFRGDLVRFPALAKTLRELVRREKRARGNRAKKIQAVRDEFYRGGIAKRIAAFSDANGGLLEYQDLAGFKADIDQPAIGTYRGYVVNKPGFWTQGPVMIETLNILEGFDLKAMGHNTPEYLHTLIEAVKLAFADRDRYYGDPKFSSIPGEILLSKEYAAERRKLINPHAASMESRPGDLGASAPPTAGPSGVVEVHDTTCVNVVDSKGNAFSATPSGAWLPSVIAGETGIPLSTRLQSFVLTEGHANQLAPGKRPRVTLSPTLVTKDGDFFMELSTPGGDNQDQALLQVLLNIIDFGMTPQEAVEAPRFQTDHMYSSFGFHEFEAGRVRLEGRIPKATADALAALGHRVDIAGAWSNSSAPTVILKRGDVLDGAADPRRARFVFGR